ncbi:MAG: TonB family protein [Proteobacteria bacterium]|nr:TonB family protein [Pseudomonadota bacterium]
MRLSTATVISLIAHVALLAALAAAWGFFAAAPSAGPGDAVSVWIEAPEGSRARAQGAASPNARPSPRDAMADPASPAGPEDRSKGGAHAASDGAGGGEAVGVAGAEGGRGKGGDALLAKIWRRIDSAKYYPAAARRRGISGEPRVTFQIGEDGGVVWARLAGSSGEAMLDEAAVATVRRAAPLPYYPAPITLAVKYSMDE